MMTKEIRERMKQQLEDDVYLTQIAKKPFEAADKNKNGSIDIIVIMLLFTLSQIWYLSHKEFTAI